MSTPAAELFAFTGGSRFSTILADPPWQFQNKTGEVAPEPDDVRLVREAPFLQHAQSQLRHRGTAKYAQIGFLVLPKCYLQ